MIDAMIFDMDGTLVNFVSQITKSWNMTCKKYNWERTFTKDEIQNVMGLNSHDIGVVLFPNINENEAQKRIEICSAEEIDYLEKEMGDTYIPNEKFLMDLSSKYSLFIVSNCLKGYIEVFLKHFHYEKYFIETVNSSNGLTKGENIHYLVEKYQLKNPVYIGDTIKDKISSEEAKVTFIHASYGFGKVDCEYKIHNLQELLKW